MSKSVSNDALWEKLSEISEQFNSLLSLQEKQVSTNDQAGKKSDINNVRDELIAEVEKQAKLLGMHGDSNYGAINQNIANVNEIVKKVWNIVARIRKQQRETVEHQTKSGIEQQLDAIEMLGKENREYFNLRFFKLRKTSVVITKLGLLVFTLTLFCMKQQNDYTLLKHEYHRQNLEMKDIKEMYPCQ